MTRSDNTHHLHQAAAARHKATTVRARAALEQLDRTGQPISVTAVAGAAGVSRSWLYTQPDLLATLNTLRDRSPSSASTSSAVPAAQRSSVASLRQRLDTSRHEIDRLRVENTELRERLARTLGEQRLRR